MDFLILGAVVVVGVMAWWPLREMRRRVRTIQRLTAELVDDIDALLLKAELPDD